MLVVDLSHRFLSFIVLLLLIDHRVNLSSYICMGLGPSSGHGQCVRSHVLKGKCHYLPPQPSAALFLLSSAGTWRPLPHSQHNVNLLDLIQLCAGKHSCCGLRHVVTINMLRSLHFLFICQFLHYFSPLFGDFFPEPCIGGSYYR